MLPRTLKGMINETELSQRRKKNLTSSGKSGFIHSEFDPKNTGNQRPSGKLIPLNYSCNAML